jgi:uncharacterized protein (DUF427 family)
MPFFLFGDPGVLMKAIWQGHVLAASNHVIFMGGQHFFPPESVRRNFLVPSERRTRDDWRGEICYFHLQTEDRQVTDAAWYYPAPVDDVAAISGYIAFGEGVVIGH